MTNVSERARETASSVCAAICMLLGDLRLTQTDVFETACSEIEPALRATATEARVAGYAEGIEKSAAHQPLSAETSERIWRLASDLDSTNPGHTEARLAELVAGSLTRERELRFRALATPAQPET